MAFSDPKLNSKLRKEAYYWNKAIKEINQAITTRKRTTTQSGKASLDPLPEVYWSDTN